MQHEKWEENQKKVAFWKPKQEFPGHGQKHKGASENSSDKRQERSTAFGNQGKKKKHIAAEFQGTAGRSQAVES